MVSSISPDMLMFGIDFENDNLKGCVDFSDYTQDKTTTKSTSSPSSVEEDEQSSCTTTSAPPRPLVDDLIFLEDKYKDDPAKEEDFHELFEWATRKGAKLENIKYGKDLHGGRGLFTTRSIAKNDIIAMLPRELRIGQKLACQRIPSLPTNTPDLSALSLLLLSFLYDDANKVTTTTDDKDNNYNDDYEWAIFGRTLPRRGEFTNAVVMNDDDLARWEKYGTEYTRAISNVSDTAHSCNRYISDYLSLSSSLGGQTRQDGEVLSKDSAIYWAIAMVLSRSHSFGSKRGRWMTPVLDLANHCPAFMGGGRLECDDQGRLLLRAGKALACGEEVTLDYQVDNDAKLVATYGFSLEHQS